MGKACPEKYTWKIYTSAIKSLEKRRPVKRLRRKCPWKICISVKQLVPRKRPWKIYTSVKKSMENRPSVKLP